MDWLHEKVAIEGLRLTLKDASDDRVWKVGNVYRGIPRSEEWVVDRRKAHERWRQVTDV
jgi:hypothetical protein